VRPVASAAAGSCGSARPQSRCPPGTCSLLVPRRSLSHSPRSLVPCSQPGAHRMPPPASHDDEECRRHGARAEIPGPGLRSAPRVPGGSNRAQRVTLARPLRFCGAVRRGSHPGRQPRPAGQLLDPSGAGHRTRHRRLGPSSMSVVGRTPGRGASAPGPRSRASSGATASGRLPRPRPPRRERTDHLPGAQASLAAAGPLAPPAPSSAPGSTAPGSRPWPELRARCAAVRTERHAAQGHDRTSTNATTRRPDPRRGLRRARCRAPPRTELPGTSDRHVDAGRPASQGSMAATEGSMRVGW
jgi:hypothetical protein